MRTIAYAFVFLTCMVYATLALPKDYCPPMPEAEKEGDRWNIPETAFTREAANEALTKLNAQVNGGVTGDLLGENEMTIVRGYLYRAYLAEYEKQFGKEDSELRAQFCAFMVESAYVSH
jgi:hypothetical protein